MKTAIILTAIVIAVIVYSLCKVSSECSRVEEQESIDWAKKWNDQRTKERIEWAKKCNQKREKDICDGECLWCSNSQFCKVKDGE